MPTNYGHIGGVVGHELTHGFDDEGRKFDGKGNLSDWWTPEDAKNFEERTNCLVEEYDSFTAVDDVKVNGKLTLGENTADNGGLRLALMAMMATSTESSLKRLRRLMATRRFSSSSLATDKAGATTDAPGTRAHAGSEVDPHSPDRDSSQWRGDEHAGVRQRPSAARKAHPWFPPSSAASGSELFTAANKMPR